MAGSKGSKYYDIFLEYTVRLNHKTSGNVLNDYKFELIRQVKEKGSLKLAADEMQVSYRKAWGSVEEVENGLGFKLLERQRGGAKGGNTKLTPEGEKLISAYVDLRKEFDDSIHKITRKFFKTLNTDEE